MKTEKNILGKHCILELSGCSGIESHETIEQILIEAALAADATVINSFSHKFGPSEGSTGVIILAESHISFHSWPEYGYAAIDLFVCGKANVKNAVKVIRERIQHDSIEVVEIDRGYILA